MERKLAKVVEIKEIRPIPGADKICAHRVDGWWVVDSIDKYSVGDLVVYCEVDSWIPHDVAPFLSKGQEPRVYNGVKGERLRTVCLRKQISQGLLLPIDEDSEFSVGEDLTEFLGIQKYEPPVPAQLAGDIKGIFPSYIPKTDQERVQNLYDEVFSEHRLEVYEVTVKLDGTSCTIYYKDGEIGVCGRNWELKETEGNTLWRCARQQKILDKLQKLGRNIAIQGEVIGEGIQKNNEKLKGQKFYVYDVYDIDSARYLNSIERQELLSHFNDSDVPHVPIIAIKTLGELKLTTIDEVLDYADGPSLNVTSKREGVVFKSLSSKFTFKAISNRWLLKNDG